MTIHTWFNQGETFTVSTKKNRLYLHPATSSFLTIQGSGSSCRGLKGTHVELRIAHVENNFGNALGISIGIRKERARSFSLFTLTVPGFSTRTIGEMLSVGIFTSITSDPT